jgi:hypothetical protein
MQARPLAFLSILCLALSGCSAYSAHPLYTAQDAVVEPALEGAWISAPKDDAEFHIQKAGPHDYTLAVSTPDDKSVQTYKLNLVRLNGQLFADMIFDKETVADKQVDPAAGTVPMHVIVCLQVTGDDLSYAVIDSDALAKVNANAIPPLQLLSTDGAVVITDETAPLRNYIAAHAAEIFTDPDHLKRKPAP